MTHFTTSYLPHHHTNCFTQIVLDYLNNDEKLHNLFVHYPIIENIESAICAKKKQNINRQILINGINAQYKELELNELLTNHISLLAHENTFTICTAHQPNIFTGPLYYIFKILHTVALCKYLKEKYSSYNFVPLYYMGSEDADIEEIGTFYMADITYKWTPEETGAVGRINTDSLQNILEQVSKYIDVKTPQGKKIFDILTKAYSTHKTLGEATIVLVNALFGQYGVIAIEPDAAIFKQQFVGIMQDELLHQSSNKIVAETNKLIAKYYKPQAHSREINLFYSIGNSKERIEKKGKLYSIINTDTTFSEQEIITELSNYPERFSPNVILRGLYQETILPNIIFVGGGGELAYWLQLKKVFEHHHTPYPMLVLRQSFSVISNNTEILAQNLKINLTEAFMPIQELQKKWVLDNNELNNFQQQIDLHAQLFESYQTILTSLPKEFYSSIEAHTTKSEKLQLQLHKKIIAGFKKKQTLQIQQLLKLKQAFFTQNILQERIENMIPLYLQFGDELFEIILKSIKPFGNEYGIIILK